MKDLIIIVLLILLICSLIALYFSKKATKRAKDEYHKYPQKKMKL